MERVEGLAGRDKMFIPFYHLGESISLLQEFVFFSKVDPISDRRYIHLYLDTGDWQVVTPR